MIKLAYEIYPEELANAKADRQELPHYHAVFLETTFRGVQTFFVNGVELGDDAVPIVDFAMSLLHAVLVFDQGGDYAFFKHLDSSWRMEFRRINGKVLISDNVGQAGRAAEADFNEFRKSILHYVRTLREDLTRQLPELLESVVFMSFLDENRQLEPEPPLEA